MVRLKFAARVVDSFDDAIAHIRRYGKASSRFSDGWELGLSAEIDISTTRLHAYGPMGAEALTVERFMVCGAG